MIAYYAKRSPGEDFVKLTTPLADGMWVHVASASDSEITETGEQYGLNANIVSDVKDRHELPRVEYANDEAYVFLRKPHLAKSGHVGTAPFLSVVKQTMFITIAIDEGLDPESMGVSTLPISTDNTATLLLGVMAGCIAEYEEIVKHTSRSIEDTANRLKTHEITSRDFVHFVTVEANLRTCRMNLEGIHAVCNRLHDNSHQLMAPESLEALDDIALHIQQLLVAINSHAQSVESIRNAYSTVANNTLNQRMKTLTVFTVLIALPNVFYGMYGMNVILPYQEEPWAYAAIVSFTISLILVVYLIAKRLRIF